MSKGGKAIIAMPSRTNDGHPRIVPFIKEVVIFAVHGSLLISLRLTGVLLEGRSDQLKNMDTLCLSACVIFVCHFFWGEAYPHMEYCSLPVRISNVWASAVNPSSHLLIASLLSRGYFNTQRCRWKLLEYNPRRSGGRGWRGEACIGVAVICVLRE